MANIEEVIYAGLIADTGMDAKLARYNGRPAVFEKQAPNDKDAQWAAAMHYPSVVFWTDLTEDAARGTMGTLNIDVSFPVGAWTTQEAGAALNKVLHGAILDTTTDGPVFTFLQGSDDYEEEDGRIEGSTIRYDLVACPAQATFDPDPITGIYDACRAILGADSAYFLDSPQGGGIIHPTSDKPAIYWQLARITSQEITNAGTWTDGQFAGHIVAPTAQARLKHGRKLMAALATSARVNYSPTMALFIRSVTETPGAHPIKQGQLVITGRWLEPRTWPEPQLLQHAYIDGQEVPQ